MSPHQRAIVAVVLIGGLIALAGLARRERAKECWAYLAYLLALTGWGLCLASWPERFYRWDLWMAKQAVLDVLKVGVALELAFRAVQAFPGARARMQIAMLTVLVVSAGMLASGPPHPYQALWEWQPQIMSATIWIFGVTAFVVVWYRLPVTDWHRALVLALTAKLFVFSVLLNVLFHFGWKVRPWVNVADGLADVAVSWTLAYMAWRPQRESVLSALLKQRLAAVA